MFLTLLANNIQILNDLHESDNNVTSQIELLTQILVDQSKQVFGKTINVKSNNKKNHTNSLKWFNQKCHQSKQGFRNARNRFNKSKSDQNRIAYSKSRTKYNRTRYKAKTRFNRSEGQRLENIAKTKPRKFWKSLKKMLQKSKQ